MVVNCPRCASRLDVPTSGEYACERCRRRFQVYLARPGAPAAQAPVYAPAPHGAESALAEARCVVHANNLADGVCERCGDFMCSLCAIPTEGRSYCARCFDLLDQRGSLETTRRSFGLPGTALTLGILSLPLVLCNGLGIALGIAAIWVGALALRQIGRQPDLPGRPKAIIGMVLGALALGLSVLFLAYLFAVGAFN